MGNAFMETFCGIFQHKYCKECNCQYVGTQPFDDALFFSDSDSLCTLIESDTISYAPYFVSNVVVVSILNVICAPSGFVNTIIQSLIGRPLLLMSSAQYFRTMYIVSNIWQTMGFSAIIYIAALTGISPEYHEAAIMDGATKLQRILHVDIPLIMPTIIIMLILALGNIMTVGYEKVYLMQAGTNTQVSEIISTYVYKVGLQNAQYSFATAVGLFNAVVNFVILVVANQITKKVSDISIF